MLGTSNKVSKVINRSGVFLVMAGSAVVGASSVAKGALVLTFSEPGFAPQSYTDSASPGLVSYIGAYGTFTTAVEIGYTDLSTPTAASAYIQLQSLDVTNIGASNTSNSLTVTLSETTPFTFPGASNSVMTLDSAMNGTLTPATTGDSVSFLSSASPALFSTVSTSLQTFTATSTNGTENVRVPEVTAQFARSASFTLADTLTASLAGGESLNVSGTTSASVPEPVAGSLLTAAAALMLCRRTRRLRI